MINHRRLLLGSSLAAIILIASACSGSSNGASTTPPPETAVSVDPFEAEQVEKVLSSDPIETLSPDDLAVCTNAQNGPFLYQDADGNWAGFEYEVLKSVADREEKTLKIVATEDPLLLEALYQLDCDLAAGGIVPTAANRESGLFTQSYGLAEQAVLTQDFALGAIASLDDISGKKVGVRTFGIGEETIRSLNADITIVPFSSTAEAIQALENSEIDVVIDDRIRVEFALGSDSRLVTLGIIPSNQGYAMAAVADNKNMAGGINGQIDYLRTIGRFALLIESLLTPEQTG